MSETKGPIERIRERLKEVRNTAGLGGAALAIQDACAELEKAEQADKVTAMTALVTDDEKRAIFKALNFGGHGGWSSQRDVGEMLARICGEWLEQRREGEADGYITLDETDDADINRAVAMLKALNAVPPNDSCERGALLAEICRGWMERVEHDRKNKEPIDNGDGTVTFPCVPVTVRAEAIEGREVLAVRTPNAGEEFVDAEDGKVRHSWDGGEEIAVIVGPKPQQPASQFFAGGYYRTRGGEVVGPLREMSEDEDGRKWKVVGWVGWFEDGSVYDDDIDESSGDLLPGEITVWDKPPASLKAGEYIWSQDGVLRGGGFIIVQSSTASYLSDWVNPTKPGRYKVPGGGKIATWEGDA